MWKISWLHMYGSISGLFCSIDLQCAEVPISPHPNQKLLLSVFFFFKYSHLNKCEVVANCCLDLHFPKTNDVGIWLDKNNTYPHYILNTFCWLLPSHVLWTHYFPAPNVLPLFWILTTGSPPREALAWVGT